MFLLGGHKLCKITTILGDLYNLIIVVNNKNEVFFLIKLQLFRKLKVTKRILIANIFRPLKDHVHSNKINENVDI